MDVSEYIALLEREGTLMAAAAERAGLLAPVPSCPGWQVRDLLRHQGHVHRWAGRYVAEALTAAVPEPGEAEILAGGPPDRELLSWFRAGHAALVEDLRASPVNLECWTFLPAPSPRAFWARRQAHETAIHRVDAELAAGGDLATFPAEFAADGLDELIMGFLGRHQRRLSAEQRAERGPSMQVRATDTSGEWLVTLTGDRTLAASVQRGGGSTTDCTLAGPAQGLYLLLWNRIEPALGQVRVSGDPGVLESWRAGMRITWE
jgi:uncharacterized protein (TIGR03083 family)